MSGVLHGQKHVHVPALQTCRELGRAQEGIFAARELRYDQEETEASVLAKFACIGLEHLAVLCVCPDVDLARLDFAGRLDAL